MTQLLAELPETSPRIQHAVLQLADGDVEKLLHFLKVAARDWRDVVYWAEYPPQPGDPTEQDTSALAKRLAKPPN